MARPSRKGGKTSEAKARNASPAEGRKATKTKPHIAPAATRVKRRSTSGPSKDLKEAREQQAATAEILKVIASSPSDVQPVFDAIAHSAKRLIGGFSSSVHRVIGDIDHLVAFTPTNPESDEVLKAVFPRHRSEMPAIISLVENGETAQIVDSETADGQIRKLARARGWRSATYTPLMNQGTFIGFIVCTRRETGMLADHHVQLLRTFADQAVIAIENTRLFNETQEASERQTATADILKVIASSPSDVQPVFEAIATSSNRLLGGFSCTVVRFIDGMAHLKAFTPTTLEADRVLQSGFPQPVSGFAPFQNAHAGEVTQVPDTEALVGRILNVSRARGFRSMLFAPLVNKGEAIGVIGVTRVQVGRFADHHVQLLKTFADQAVIAIENVRLFDEVQAKTRDLTEALTYQTGSANILSVIASSPTDVGPVLDAIVESACELCEADDAVLLLKDGNDLRYSTHHGPIPITMERRAISRNYLAGRSVVDKLPIHVRDLLSEEGDEFPGSRELSRANGIRSILCVPLLRDSESIGTILLRRAEVHAFSEKQIKLLQTFADQAVIAIGNVRLFDEVQAKTRDLTEALSYQTGSANILKVIASSPTDVGPVLKAIVETACELCDATDALVHLRDGDHLRYRAHHGPIPVGFENEPVNPINRNWVTGRSVLDKVTIHLQDVLSAEGADFPEGRRISRRDGTRTLLTVPLLRENESIGVIVLRRIEVKPFSDKQIALLQTFADQAVIAIGNARLFEQVQERTRELSQSLDDLRTAQDRLIQTEKLASLGQLTAGIAHEIKNPLNFVNNFSALSAELTDELNDVLKPVTLDGKVREEVDELTGMLRSNLEKVVQHGQRADSIVKNMLLHSREGSREHRPADINSLLDESLNLAYHGARAEKGEFNVTLQRDFDADAGTIELFPQEITRAFLNLIANGVYAATRRKNENKEPGFEPTLRATTKNLGTTVEIRIRDNGTGIPVEVREKMFNPFFTTKPAGEGTGLGLSMTHDIIVKQHGGRIDVATEPGQFTEFIIVLPRMAATGKAGADK